MSSVDAWPFLRTVSSAERRPFARTILVCTCEAVAHLGDVFHVDRGAIDGLHRHIVQPLNGERAAVQLHDVFAVADLGGSGGQDQVLLIHRVGDVGGGEMVGVQRGGVDIDHDGPRFAAIRQGDGRPVRWQAGCG